MSFINFPAFAHTQLALFGIILLLGLLGGEIARRTRFLPPIMGYIAVGFLVGPTGFNIVGQPLLNEASIFVDISTGLVLFQLGKHLDFRWLKHDPSLFLMSLAESSFTFIFVMFIMHACGISWISSSLAAAIAVTTSPAVVMMVAHDLRSEGPVTRRALILTSLNNLYGVVAFIILLPLSTKESTSAQFMFEYYGYQLLCSMLLGLVIFLITVVFAKIIGKHKQNQFVLYISTIILTIALARAYNLSMMLSLLTFGLATRNLDWKHYLTEIDFEWFARISFILLFVLIGLQIQLYGLRIAAFTVIAFIVARFIAKSCAVFLLASKSRLTHQQAISISLALTPMASIALGLSNKFLLFNDELGYQLVIIIGSVVAIYQVLGPIATQYAFISANETVSDKNQA